VSPSIATIGVYEFDAPSFLATLRGADVALVVDVRQRRGVRGPRAEYIRRYTTEILDRAPLEALVQELPPDRPAALMCVEALAAACHRSLVAQRLHERFGLPVVHLEPG
jgi:Domain of unknown function DUF488